MAIFGLESVDVAFIGLLLAVISPVVVYLISIGRDISVIKTRLDSHDKSIDEIHERGDKHDEKLDIVRSKIDKLNGLTGIKDRLYWDEIQKTRDDDGSWS